MYATTWVRIHYSCIKQFCCLGCAYCDCYFIIASTWKMEKHAKRRTITNFLQKVLFFLKSTLRVPVGQSGQEWYHSSCLELGHILVSRKWSIFIYLNISAMLKKILILWFWVDVTTKAHLTIQQFLNFIYLFKYFHDVKWNINSMILSRCYYKSSFN